MRRDYDTIVLGCSCFGMGCAAQDPENTLIIESTEAFGGEFTDALRECGLIARPEGEAAALYDELIGRGIMDEASAKKGEIHLPAVNIVLNRIALEKKLNILFRTRVIAVNESGTELEAVCSAKLYRFTCRRIVDTRQTDHARIRTLDSEAGISFAANLYAPTIPEEKLCGMRVKKGFLPGEAYLVMDVFMPSSGDREALLDRFAGRPAEWKACRLLQTASEYSVRTRPIREKTEKGWFVPGCGFNDPIAAWEAGLTEKEALR